MIYGEMTKPSCRNEKGRASSVLEEERILEHMKTPVTRRIRIKKYEYLKRIMECSGSFKNAKSKFKKSKFPIKIKSLLEKFFKTLDYVKKYESEIFKL